MDRDDRVEHNPLADDNEPPKRPEPTEKSEPPVAKPEPKAAPRPKKPDIRAISDPKPEASAETQPSGFNIPAKKKSKKGLWIGLIVAVLLAALGGGYVIFFMKDLSGRIIIPYIAHQPPRIDPHVPGHTPLSDKLDELMFEGLFNVAANPSGIAYEDGLGEFMGIDGSNVVSIRLRPGKKWHSSFNVSMEEETFTITEKEAVRFSAEDLRFTLRRILALGSVSPDYILVSQAMRDFDFSGPDNNHEIRFQFRGDRMWTEADIKEVLSFKVIPASSGMNDKQYLKGTGPYLKAGELENKIYFRTNPDQKSFVPQVQLNPFIDNSTYTTELRNKNINVLLSTPFGAESPVLQDAEDYFHKPTISTTFFALFFNFQKLNREQRKALRSLIDRKKVMDRFFKLGTEQQRHIANYKGKGDNYSDYVNYSIFPTTTYYVEESVVMPLKEYPPADLSVLPDTVRIQTVINHGFKEELSELAAIMNDPSVFNGKLKVSTVTDADIAKGQYDAVLVPVSGYRSNFLFDLYDIFLREPSFAAKRIHLQTTSGRANERAAHPSSFKENKNFFGLDLTKPSEEKEDISKLLEYVYGFMSTSEIGDKQAYAQYLDELDQEMALGSWLFSLPSLAYFSTQFDESTIHLYGIASQLSTIEKWKEKSQ